MTAAPQVGDVFGRYRIDARLGEGGMGVVFLATDLAMQREVALKVVSAHLGASAEFQQRFEREASVLARLSSPHVIEIFRYGTEEGCAYIATQYVGGGDLGGLLAARGPLPPGPALAVCAQMADALQDAHRVGVVHRDVKPTNVLIRDPDAAELHAYLCDFGIARSLDEAMTAPGVVTGTWSYLSPECGRGASGTFGSDIYALGCLVWATLTGTAPYRGTDVEIAVAHQRALLPSFRPSGPLSAAVNEILRRTMAKDPRERYPDAGLLRRALLEAADLPPEPLLPTAPGQLPAPPSAPASAPSSAPPTAPPWAAPRSGRRRRGVALASLALVAVAGSALVIVKPWAGSPGNEPVARPSSSTNPPSSEPTPTSSPSEVATSPTGPASAPTRLDQGGPITGDLDQDGLGDVAVVYAQQRRGGSGRGGAARATFDVTDFLSDATSFRAGETRSEDAPDGFVQETTFGDFDGDELIERLVVRTAAGSVADLRLRAVLSGGGKLDARVPQPSGAKVINIGVADVDGDANDDVVLQHVEAGGDNDGARSLDVVLIRGGDAGRPRRFFTNTDADLDTTLGDFDGDGLSDIALVSARDPDAVNRRYDVRFLLNDGDGGTEPGPAATYTSMFVPFVLAADLDGDEDDELVVVGYRAGTDAARLDLDAGKVSEPAILADFRSFAGNTAVIVSDVDGDGLDDLVALTSGRRAKTRLLVARNSGDSSFTVSRWATWDRPLGGPGLDYDLGFQGGPLP